MAQASLHCLEIFQLIKKMETTLKQPPREALELITNAIDTKYTDEVIKFMRYPSTYNAFHDKDLHILYYVTAGAGIDKIRKLVSVSQPRVYRIKDHVIEPITFGPGLPTLLDDAQAMENLQMLVQELHPMNGFMLPDYSRIPNPFAHLDIEEDHYR